MSGVEGSVFLLEAPGVPRIRATVVQGQSGSSNGADVLCSAWTWASGEDDHVVARAEYDFSAASEDELSLRAGDVLNLAPKGDALLQVHMRV